MSTGLALTQRQADLLAFIRERIAATGVSPSFDEMKEALGLHSKSGIHRLIEGLVERGAIRRMNYRARAIELVEWSEYSRGVRDGLLIARGLTFHSDGIMQACSAIENAAAKASEAKAA